MKNSNSPTNTAPVRILIVDDHPNMARTLARAVSQLGQGIEVLSAESGEQALELVHKKTLDLLITDMVMPGINGLELIEKLQSHPSGRPAYTALITAYDVPGLKESARRLKVNDVINKPIRPEHICQIITKAIADLERGSASQAADAKPQFKILIADDLSDNVALLSRYLENEGYICISAANGEQALVAIRTEMPDLVLLDVNMPVKDGFETLQEIRTDPAIAHIPVIILTAARLEPIDMQYALNIGADDYVTKPFDRRELLARIRTRLRVKETEDIIRLRNKELNLLPEIGRVLSARLDVNELTDLVLHRTVETLGAMLGHIIFLTPKGQGPKSFHFPVSTSSSSPFQPPDLKNLLSQINETHQGVIISDAHEDIRWRVAPDDPTRSVVVAPMFGRLGLLGLLVLAHEQSGYFRLEHKLLLQAIASQAAIALENAQLYSNMIQSQQKLASVLQGPIHAAILFDKEGRLKWLSPAGEKMFANHPVELGESLKPGDGYDPLLDLLDDTRTGTGFKIGKITWPDDCDFTATLTPMESGGYLALFYSTTFDPDSHSVERELTDVI